MLVGLILFGLILCILGGGGSLLGLVVENSSINWSYVADFFVMLLVQFCILLLEKMSLLGDYPTMFEFTLIVLNSFVVTFIFYGYNKLHVSGGTT